MSEWEQISRGFTKSENMQILKISPIYLMLNQEICQDNPKPGVRWSSSFMKNSKYCFFISKVQISINSTYYKFVHFYIFILGLGFLHDGTIYTIFNSGLLGLSLEGLLRRNWLLLGDLFARYWNFCHPTSVIFHGLVSLHLSFSRQLSPKVQPKPLCKYHI